MKKVSERNIKFQNDLNDFFNSCFSFKENKIKKIIENKNKQNKKINDLKLLLSDWNNINNNLNIYNSLFNHCNLYNNKSDLINFINDTNNYLFSNIYNNDNKDNYVYNKKITNSFFSKN
jgi:hypothetical protein